MSKKKSIIPVRVGQKTLSLGITVFHHSASLVMPNGDPLDDFLYLTLTLTIGSYIFDLSSNIRAWRSW